MKHTILKSALAAFLLVPVGAAFAQGDTAAAPAAKVEYKNRAPVAKTTLRVRFPRPKHYILPNGLRLLVLENHKLPTISISMSILAGSFFEPAEKTGLASMTANMLDEGTKTRTSEGIAAAVDRLGGSLSASADQGGERAGVSSSGLSRDTDALLALMRDIVRNPTFPQSQFVKIQRRTVAGLERAQTDPGTLADVQMMKAVYGDTPPARVLPTVDQVKALTTADLTAFHAAYYRPDRTIVAVVGDVKADVMAAKIKKAFGDWKKGTEPLKAGLPAYAPQTKQRIFVVDRPGSVQTAIRLGNLAITRKSPDYVPFAVMNRILGGGSSITSRLGQNIREAHGYTYDVRSTLDAPRYLGYWGAQTDVRNAVTQDTVKQFLYEFDRIVKQPVSTRELANAKRGMIGSFARALESPETILGRALDLVEFGLPADYWDKYPAAIDKVTKGDVQRVAAKYIRNLQIVAVGEKAAVSEALKPYGEIETP
ncbi:MAG TPA: pitrilysin family protein [Armatimonadota bacterium]|jgi:predicted Zn-dependent peptidase